MPLRPIVTVILVCFSMLLPASPASPATAVAGDTTVRRTDLPTRSDVARIYPWLSGEKRAVSSSRLLLAHARGCVFLDVLAAGEDGLSATYDGSQLVLEPVRSPRPVAVVGRDRPAAAVVAFAGKRAAKRAMAEVEGFVDRCTGTTTRRGVTQTVKALTTKRFGDGRSASFRSHQSADGYDSYGVDVFTRVQDVVLWTTVTNGRRGPSRAKALLFHDLQVQARGRVAG